MSQRSANNPRNTQGEKSGTMKRSIARAKPKTAAAGTVRLTESKAKSGGRALTKEERKKAELDERNDRNRNLACTNVLLKKDPEYAKGRKVWGAVLVLGLVLTIVSWVVLMLAPANDRTTSSVYGRISVGCLVVAYICVIGSFIYDWVRLRKIRNAMEEKVNGMSEHRVEEILRDEAFERQARKEQGFFARFRGGSKPAEEGRDGE